MTVSRSAPPRKGPPSKVGSRSNVPGARSKGRPGRDISTPLGPVAMVGACAVIACVLVLIAFAQGAGTTDSVSALAALSWIVGSVIGLLAFRSVDMGCRAEIRYVEPSWRPRLIALWLAVVGWLGGSVGAFFVAEALARR
jgi:hypothetical protein